MLALIAGTGALPGALVTGLRERPLICALQGNDPQVDPALTFRLEHLGTFLGQLQQAGVTQVCMAGGIARPQIDASQIDAATQPLVPRLMQALGQGDDGALRVVIEIFEEAGLAVLAAQDLMPDLLPPEGVLTREAPDDAAHRDARAGEAALIEMARADVGQACIVKHGQVFARERQDGTDAMLTRLRPATGGNALDTLLSPVDVMGEFFETAADWLGGPDAKPLSAMGGILFKGPKPGQDRRADLPVIGPDTVAGAAAVGLRGIVIDAGGVMILDRAATVAACDKAELFLWVRPGGAA